MASIRKIPSLVSYPVTSTNNQIYYVAPNEQGQIDMASSYKELELQILDNTTNAQLTDLHNVVLGHDGLLYNGSCLYRQSKLLGVQSHKALYDLNYINILSNNLEYYTKGKYAIKADSLYSGQGATSYDNSVYSVFNNEYPDQNPTLKVPLSVLYHGSLGQSDMLPQEEDLEFRFLMEPQYKVLMRAVNSTLYLVDEGSDVASCGDVPATTTTIYLLSATNPFLANKPVTINSTINGATSSLVKTASAPTQLGNSLAFADANANTVIFPASAVGTVGQLAQNQYVKVNFTSDGTAKSVYRKITALTPDNGQTVGSITLDSTPDATNAMTVITVQKCPTITINSALDGANNATGVTVTASNISGGIVCNPLGAAGLVLTLTDQNKTSAQQDLYKNTTVNVHYVDASGVKNTLKSYVTSIALTGNNVQTVTLKDQVPICAYVSLEPLYTNLDSYKWSLVNSHIVLYRRHAPSVSHENLLISDYESRNVQCLGGLDKFMYNFKFDSNCYNIYVMTPTSTNLYSEAQGIQSYLMSVNEKQLTSIYVDVSGVVHYDNLVRVLSNSQYNNPRNINNKRDDDIKQGKTPLMFPAKVFNSVLGGKLNIQNFESMDNDVRVELVASNLTTPTMVYCFGERFNRV